LNFMATPSKQVDVLVVGGGPAGSRAALGAAQAGASVVLIDKQSRLGGDPRCAEWIPQALSLEMHIPSEAIVQPVKGMQIHLPGYNGTVAMPGHMLDRRVFDFLMARQAVEAGAELWASTRLEALRPGRAFIKQGSRQLSLGYSALVAADGARSQTASLLGFARQPVMAAVNLEVPLAKELNTTLVYLRPQYRLGYAWLFPKGGMANLGLGCVIPKGLRDLLGSLQDEMIGQGLIGRGVLGVSAGALPVGGLREILYKEGVFFCGDAAGLTHAVTGAGIPQALDSGLRAGQAAAAYAAGFLDAGPGYAQEVINRWGGYLKRGLAARKEQEANWDQDSFTELMARTWPAWPKQS
jgi:digeranylgeranylglycerophospholipid reductase